MTIKKVSLLEGGRALKKGKIEIKKKLGDAPSMIFNQCRLKLSSQNQFYRVICDNL